MRSRAQSEGCQYAVMDEDSDTLLRNRHVSLCTRHSLRIMILLTLILQLVTLIILLLAPGPQPVDIKSTLWVIIAIGCIQSIQFIVLCTGTWLAIKAVWGITLGKAWLLYLCQLLAFAGFYSFVYVSIDHAFTHDSDLVPHGETETVKLGDMYVVFLYFSVSTQSLVGFGDISPVNPFAQGIAAVQMVLGTFYSIFILAQTVTRFERPEKSRKGPKVHGRFHRLSRIRPLKRMRRFFRRFLLVFTILWQLLDFLILYLAVDNIFDKQDKPILAVSIVFELVQLVSILSTSLKFVRKTYKVTVVFLLSSYLAIIITFASCYVLLYVAFGGHGNAFALPPELWKVYGVEPQTSSTLWPLILEFMCE